MKKTTQTRSSGLKRKKRCAPRDWSKIDWNSTTAEIRRITGASMKTVCKYRGKHAPNTIRVPPSMHVHWDKIDWNQSTAQIRKLTGASTATVCRYRKEHAPKTMKKIRPTLLGTIVNWHSIDWKKSSEQIRIESGATIGTIEKMRKELAPETITERIVSRFDWSQIDWRKSNKLIAEETGQKLCIVANARSTHNPNSYQRYGHQTRINGFLIALEKIDWKKSNKQLKAEFGMTENQVCNLRRRHAPDTRSPLRIALGSRGGQTGQFRRKHGTKPENHKTHP